MEAEKNAWKYPKNFQDGYADEEESNRWLKSAVLKSKTEGLIVAAQDQVLKTKYMQAKIINNGADPNYRICGRFKETVDHNIWMPWICKDWVCAQT